MTALAAVRQVEPRAQRRRQHRLCGVGAKLLAGRNQYDAGHDLRMPESGTMLRRGE